jgi:calcium binding protein
MSTAKGAKRKSSSGNLPRLSKQRLEELVEEAIVDAYNESEQTVGLFTMMEDNLKLPFETEILGVSVTVEKVDMTDDDHIVAVCTRSGKKQEISILSLPLPSPPPEGWEWIAAYRYWRRGFE